MVTISICMIVKNEERILKRCLDSLKGLAEEIVIVDTGSTDRTKEIASSYTDKVYDFQWIGDFAAARNFAFSKATQEYIYSADADEVLDQKNQERFALLKANLLPEIELVQMKYGNQLQFGTIYNYDEEYRPKLFKRVRGFQWMDPIHETVRVNPVIYDSDIVITHMPEAGHTARDLQAFETQIAKGAGLSERLHTLYAKELFVSGTEEDFKRAYDFFAASALDADNSLDVVKEACCIAARSARYVGDITGFFKYAMKAVACDGCSEICCELGAFYESVQDWEEAAVWYYNAAYETTPLLYAKAGQKIPLQRLAACYRAMGNEEQAVQYEAELLNGKDI